MPDPQNQSWSPGNTIGAWVLTEPLGGSSWLAEKAGAETLAVLRRLGPKDALRDLLGREIPHVAKIASIESTESGLLAVETWCTGASLESILAEKAAFSASEAANLVAQIAEALQGLHAQGLCHGGLRPSRILVDEDHVILVGAGRRPAQAGTTSPYVSPELADGAEPSPKDDIYALGVLLFQLFCQAVPKGVDLPSELVPSLPGGLDEVFRNSYARASRRYAQAQAFLEDFTPVKIEIESQEEPESRDPGPLQDLWVKSASQPALLAENWPKLSKSQALGLVAALPQPILLAWPESEVKAFVAKASAWATFEAVPAGKSLWPSGDGGYGDEEPVEPPKSRPKSLLLSMGCLFAFLALGLLSAKFGKGLWTGAPADTLQPAVSQIATEPEILDALAVLRVAADAHQAETGRFPSLPTALFPRLRALGRPDLCHAGFARHLVIVTEEGTIMALPKEPGQPSYLSEPGQPPRRGALGGGP